MLEKMASSWFRNIVHGKKSQKSAVNGIKIKDEEQQPCLVLKSSKSATLEKPDPPPKRGAPMAVSNGPVKSKSVDEADPELYGFQSLEEALQLLADDSQPLVARSTPKGAPIDTSNFHYQQEMKGCLFERGVYEQMLKDSLNVCEVLQHNLDDLIVEVRKSPAREVENVTNGILSDQQEALVKPSD